jgi:glycosyltransferase involved in cell wall biosynthesis
MVTTPQLAELQSQPLLAKKRPIRVMHLTSVEKPNYYLNNLSDFSSRDAVEFTVCTTGKDEGFIEELQQRGVHGRAFDRLRKIDLLSAYRETLKAVRDFDPDILQTHLFEPSLIGALAARRSGKRLILTRHHSDPVHRLRNIAKRKFYGAIDGYVARAAHAIVVPSQRVKKCLIREQADPDKITVIPYGQNPERFNQVTPDRVVALRRELKMDGSISLVYVSRLFHEKGHRFLFEALARLTKEGLNLKLYLPGTGEEQSALADLARKLAVEDRIVFLGWRNDALDIMAAADLVVHPSLGEALPSVVIEACVLEKPLVLTSVSSAQDITDGHATIVEPEDSAALADGIRATLRELPAATARARKAKAHVLSYMDPQRVADAYLDCYQRVMGQKVGAQ